ncbi:MAG: hypothetical protein JXR95_02305 [Deltaproteobacteria bacterium]|nr:hypothetical protein [Deltaproteobacteria bacterium]
MKLNQLTILIFSLILSAGCDQQSSDGLNGYNSLLRLIEEPEGEHCIFGGFVVQTGLDRNQNLILDPDEVDDISYLCQAEPDILCNCEDGEDGTDGHNTLMLVLDEDPGSNCRYGGKSIRWGLDLDDDGILTVSEITGTEYVCNGEIGPPTLIEIEEITHGGDCSNGGKRIITGVDENYDGILSTEEIDSEDFVCNGTDGHDSLIRLEEEDGTYCINGGTTVFSGPDLNDDGILQDEEITDEAYVCQE